MDIWLYKIIFITYGIDEERKKLLLGRKRKYILRMFYMIVSFNKSTKCVASYYWVAGVWNKKTRMKARKRVEGQKKNNDK